MQTRSEGAKLDALRDNEDSWWIGNLGDSGSPQENVSQLGHMMTSIVSCPCSKDERRCRQHERSKPVRRDEEHDEAARAAVRKTLIDIVDTATVRPSAKHVEHHLGLETGTTSQETGCECTMKHSWHGANDTVEHAVRDEEQLAQGLKIGSRERCSRTLLDTHRHGESTGLHQTRRPVNQYTRD